jgi:hypothetical protein
MVLMACPECSEQVSSVARACPHCGFPVGDVERLQRLKIVKLVLLAGLANFVLVGGVFIWRWLAS